MQPAADMNTPESACAPTCHVRLRSSQSLTLNDSPLLRDELHPEVARMLLDWAGSTRSTARLVVCIEAPVSAEPLTQEQVTRLLGTHFRRVADAHTQGIADIFRQARAATLIGLLVLVFLMSAAQAIPDDAGRWMVGVRESVVIFAWVAMWKPAELWLYDHWPLRHWRRAALRLADAQVRLVAPG